MQTKRLALETLRVTALTMIGLILITPCIPMSITFCRMIAECIKNGGKLEGGYSVENTMCILAVYIINICVCIVLFVVMKNLILKKDEDYEE